MTVRKSLRTFLSTGPPIPAPTHPPRPCTITVPTPTPASHVPPRHARLPVCAYAQARPPRLQRYPTPAPLVSSAPLTHAGVCLPLNLQQKIPWL